MNTRYNTYVRNYNIIAHIRNAFAHGNVKISSHVGGDTLLDRKIVIDDIYNGESTYKVVVTYKDFFKLFNNRICKGKIGYSSITFTVLKAASATLRAFVSSFILTSRQQNSVSNGRDTLALKR